jgi:ABC-type nitrate/sulfonate/bicarbonate transport system substrate-binding protein
MKTTRRSLLVGAAAVAAAKATGAVTGARAQALDKLQFRLNWTLYGEHAPFFVALDKGFYREEGLDVQILEGSGSTTVAQLVANPQAKEQAVLNGQADALLGYFMDQGPRMQLQSGVKMGWTRLYDMAGVSTLSSAVIVNNNWANEAKNQDILRRFLRASQRAWDYADKNRDEAAKLFLPHAPAFNMEIAVLEVNGTMTIIHSAHTKDKPLFWSAKEDWQESQDLLQKYAKMAEVKDVGVYYTNEYLSQPPYMPKA